MVSRPFRKTFASLAFGLFSIFFVFPISESVAVTSCKGSASDAATLALRGLTVSCFGQEFKVRTFNFIRDRKAYVLRGDIGPLGPIAGPDAQDLKFEVIVGQSGKSRQVRFIDRRGLRVRANDSNVRLLLDQLAKKVQADIKVRFRECAQALPKSNVRDHRIPKPECLLDLD